MPILHSLLQNLQDRKSTINFIQIGAYDGIIRDPIHQYTKNPKYHGILLEPLPDIFKILQKTYQSNPNITLENYAIYTENITKIMYRITPDVIKKHKLDPNLSGCNSFYKSKNKLKRKNLRKHVTTEQVQCITIDILLDKYSITALDLLLIDTEGYDLEIIKTFPYHRLKPTIIYYETYRNKNIHAKQELQQADQTLQIQGYSLTNEGPNTTAHLVKRK